MRTLVIFTGGTIASVPGEHGLAPDSDPGRLLHRLQVHGPAYSVTEEYNPAPDSDPGRLLRRLQAPGPEDMEFDIRVPYTILSENLEGKYLNILVRCLYDSIDSGIYDGIIITHGTDTLPFCAAALSILFSDTDIPVLLVSANAPAGDIHSNAAANFNAAVNYIAGKKPAGVYAVYQNTGDKEAGLYDAAGVLRQEMYSDDVNCLSGFTGCGFAKRGLTEREFAKRELTEREFTGDARITPALARVRKDLASGRFYFREPSPVLYLRLCPGMAYPKPGPEVSAVLFGSYHSGTLPSSDARFRRFCAAMSEDNVRMYVCGVPEGKRYESMRFFEEAGIEILPYGTDAYWYMMLWILNS